MNELTTTFRIESPPAWLEIGYDAENNWRTISINCEYWFNIDANGIVVLMYKPACSKPAYPLKVERSGNNIVWTPESAELVAGVGTMQAFFEVDGVTIGASKKIPCEVDSSLLGSASGGTPPWAIDLIEQIKELTGHYPYVVDGKLYVWDSVTEDWIEFTSSGGGAVDSVNGQTGVVVLDAEDVGAYEKPSGGIPKTDLASAVQTSLGKADTAVQPSEISGMATETWVEQQGYQTAPFEIPVTKTGEVYTTTATAANILANKDNMVVLYSDAKMPPTYVYQNSSDHLLAVFQYFTDDINGNLIGTAYKLEVSNGNVYIDVDNITITPLPTVTSSDNGKVLGVVNGAWAVKADEGVSAPFEIQVSYNSATDTYTTTASAEDILANVGNLVLRMPDGTVFKESIFIEQNNGAHVLFSVSDASVNGKISAYTWTVTVLNNSVSITSSGIKQTAIVPDVSSIDNGKFLRVVSGAWAAVTVPSAESNSFGGGS